MKHEEKRSLSKREINANIHHFFEAFILPILLCTILSIIVSLTLGKREVTIVSPRSVFSNISNFVSMMLGFLFVFMSIILGFSSTPHMKLVFSKRAPRFQFWCNILTPILFGLLLWGYTTMLSALLPDTSCQSTIVALLPFCASILLFIISFFTSCILFIKFINVAVKE